MDLQSEASGDNRWSFFTDYKIPFVFGVISLILVLIGLRLLIFPLQTSSIEFSDTATNSGNLQNEIKIDISGAVISPGVYSLTSQDRVQDLLVKAGGLASDADRIWVSKYLNLAGKLNDGTKIYIPFAKNNSTGVVEAESISNGIVNINSASINDLDKLPGIGEVTAQKIISGRPYGAIDELITKKIISQSVFEKIKEKIGVY